MRNDKDEEGLNRHPARRPTNHSEDALQGNDNRQTDPTVTGRPIPDDRRRGLSVETVGLSRGVRTPDGSTSAARLRRCSRLPRPTASAPNDVMVEDRQNDDSTVVRRTRHLPTLQGVVISSPTYSATLPTACLVASITSKCRIPAPVTTRRISSWTDCGNSKTSVPRVKVDGPKPSVSEHNSRAEDLSSNVGDAPTSVVGTSPGDPDGNDDDSAVRSTPELKSNARFSTDCGRLRQKHVCCSCSGTGLVPSHLLCDKKEVEMRSRRRTSPRVARVYRFDASAGHRVAVARVAVESGLETLSSGTRRFDVTSDNESPQTTSGSLCDQKHNSGEQTASGHVDDELQRGEIVKHEELEVENELPDSQLSEVAELDEHLLVETESKQTLLVSSNQNNHEPVKTTVQLSTISRIPRLTGRKLEMCKLLEAQDTSHISKNDIKKATSTSQSAHNKQLASLPSIPDEGQTTETEVSEKSMASKFRKTAKRRSGGCQVSPINSTTTSGEKSTISKAAKVSVTNKNATTHHEPTRRKRSERGAEDRQNVTRKRHASFESSQTESEQTKFVTLSGRDVPIDFGFMASDGMRTRSPLSVTFADKDEKAKGRELATRPQWRDLVVATVPHQQQQDCPVAANVSAEDSPDTTSGQEKNLPMSELRWADQSIVSQVTLGEEFEVKRYPTSVTEAYPIESFEDLYTPENLVVTEQTTFSCADTNVSHVEQRHPPSMGTSTASFLIGAAPLPSLGELQRKRPASLTDDSHSVEPTPSFISCSASEKDFPQTPARQKNSTHTPFMRRKTSAAKEVGSSSTMSYNRLSSVSARCSKNLLSSLPSSHTSGHSSLSTRQTSDQNKNSSKLKTISAKSTYQLKSERLRASSATGKHAETFRPAGRMERSQPAPSVTGKRRTKDLSGRERHREKEQGESRKQTGPIDLSFTPTSGRSKCTNSKKQATDSGAKIHRVKHRMLQKFNLSSELSDRSQFDARNTSEQANKFDEVFFAPFSHSTCCSDEISKEPSSPSVKKSDSFFVSFQRSGSRTATTASRIPRPQISSFTSPARSHSYVVSSIAARTWRRACTLSSSTKQALADRHSTNANPSSTFTDLRHPITNDSGCNHKVILTLEPHSKRTRCNSEDPIMSQDTNELNCAQSCRISQNDDSTKLRHAEENQNQSPYGSTRNLITQDLPADSKSIEERSMSQMTVFAAESVAQKPWGQVTEKLNQTVDDASLNALPASRISLLTTQDTAAAIVIETIDEHSSSMSHCVVRGAVVPSEQLAILPAEPNLNQLPVELRSNKVHTSSNVNQAPDYTLQNVISPDKLSNIAAKESTAATDRIEKYSISIPQSQCTIFEAVPELQVPSSKQSLQLALSSSILSNDRNREWLPVKSCSNQTQFTSIKPVKYIDSAACKTAEQLLSFTTINRECPDKAEVAKLESGALEIICATQPELRTKTSNKSSYNKSAKAVGQMSLNIGLEVRLRQFDEVSIELPDILWNRVQSEEFRHPEVARVCQSMCEAVVLRNDMRQTSPPTRRRTVGHLLVVPSQLAKFQPALPATAETSSVFVDSSAELSIDVVHSRADQSVQSVETAFHQLIPPNLSSWMNCDDTEVTSMTTETNTIENYISAKRYLEQLADDLASADQLTGGNVTSTSLASGSKQNKNRQSGNGSHLDDLPIMGKSKGPGRPRVEVEEEESERCYKAKEQDKRRVISTSSYTTSAPVVTSKKIKAGVNSMSQPRLELPRNDLGSTAVGKNDANEAKSDDDQLPVNTVARMNKNGDGEVSDEALPVLTATDKRGAGDEPCRQTSEDHEGQETNVDQQPRLASGE